MGITTTYSCDWCGKLTREGQALGWVNLYYIVKPRTGVVAQDEGEVDVAGHYCSMKCLVQVAERCGSSRGEGRFNSKTHIMEWNKQNGET